MVTDMGGQTLLTASLDHTVRSWNIHKGQCMKVDIFITYLAGYLEVLDSSQKSELISFSPLDPRGILIFATRLFKKFYIPGLPPEGYSLFHKT